MLDAYDDREPVRGDPCDFRSCVLTLSAHASGHLSAPGRQLTARCFCSYSQTGSAVAWQP